MFENPRQQRSILLITNCFCHKESHYQAKLIFGKTQNLILETLKINFSKNSTLIVGLLDCFIFFPKKVQRGKGSRTEEDTEGIWALPVWGGRGLNPCPDGLGHFFRDEVPQSARLSAGGGAIAKRAMPKCLRYLFRWGFPYDIVYDKVYDY